MSLQHLDTLKNISQKLDSESYLKIYELIVKVGVDCVCKFEIPPENIFIYRALIRKDKEYCNKTQISFNPDPVKYGRANRKDLKVFYGTIQIPGQQHAFIPNIYELIEIDNKQVNSNKINNVKLIVGAWKMKKKIPSIPIIYSKKTLNKFEILKPLVDNYIKTERAHNIEILKFISDEFAKESHGNQYSYQISAAFSEFWFTNSHNKAVILYPTVRSEQGVNIAIHADYVEEYLELAHVWTTDIYFKENAIVTDYLKHTNKIDSNGNFKLEKSNDSKSNQGYDKCEKKLHELLSKKN